MEKECKVEETKLGTRTYHPSYGTLLFNRGFRQGKNNIVWK